MKTTLTVTRKGQTTIPVELRRRLGISSQGGALVVEYDEASQTLIMKAVPDLRDIAKRFGKYIKPGTEPLINVSEWMIQNRRADKNGYVD